MNDTNETEETSKSESVIKPTIHDYTQAALAFILTLGVVILYIVRGSVPPDLLPVWGIVIGTYFGKMIGTLAGPRVIIRGAGDRRDTP